MSHKFAVTKSREPLHQNLMHIKTECARKGSSRVRTLKQPPHRHQGSIPGPPPSLEAPREALPAEPCKILNPLYFWGDLVKEQVILLSTALILLRLVRYKVPCMGADQKPQKPKTGLRGHPDKTAAAERGNALKHSRRQAEKQAKHTRGTKAGLLQASFKYNTRARAKLSQRSPKKEKGGDLFARAVIRTGHSSHSPTRTSVLLLGRELDGKCKNPCETALVQDLLQSMNTGYKPCQTRDDCDEGMTSVVSSNDCNRMCQATKVTLAGAGFQNDGNLVVDLTSSALAYAGACGPLFDTQSADMLGSSAECLTRDKARGTIMSIRHECSRRWCETLLKAIAAMSEASQLHVWWKK
eukprot:1159765-Pelagomonas_calceolata.AAC.15